MSGYIFGSQAWGRGTACIEQVEIRDAAKILQCRGQAPHDKELPIFKYQYCQGWETLPYGKQGDSKAIIHEVAKKWRFHSGLFYQVLKFAYASGTLKQAICCSLETY